jgi:hypothetical protein
MVAIETLLVRIVRLEALSRGFAFEDVLVSKGDDPLLYRERKAYLEGIRAAMAGVESARVSLTRARIRLTRQARPAAIDGAFPDA